MAYGSLSTEPTFLISCTRMAMLDRAVTIGDPEVMHRLAKVPEGGLGDEPDPVRALTLYHDAATAAIPASINDMGYFSFTSELGLHKGSDKALEPFRQAADDGHTEAMFNLASFAANGLVPELGPKDAAELLYRSLRGGSELALDGLLGNPDRFPEATWAELQSVLAENALYDGPIDGSFGPGTRRAILAAYGIFE